MTDRELLEAAAKAAGIELLWHNFSNIPSLWEGLGSDTVWNPLTDDSDALRLAVKLGLLITQIKYEPGLNAYGAVGIAWHGQRYDFDYEHFTDDPYTATRRAIVRAAAEIGRGMK